MLIDWTWRFFPKPFYEVRNFFPCSFGEIRFYFYLWPINKIPNIFPWPINKICYFVSAIFCRNSWYFSLIVYWNLWLFPQPIDKIHDFFSSHLTNRNFQGPIEENRYFWDLWRNSHTFQSSFGEIQEVILRKNPQKEENRGMAGFLENGRMTCL